jgi:hypothetical protein
MLINAAHAALEDREIAFGRIGVNVTRTYSLARRFTVSWDEQCIGAE